MAKKPPPPQRCFLCGEVAPAHARTCWRGTVDALRDLLRDGIVASDTDSDAGDGGGSCDDPNCEFAVCKWAKQVRAYFKDHPD